MTYLYRQSQDAVDGHQTTPMPTFKVIFTH